jgi:hypothetical protein
MRLDLRRSDAQPLRAIFGWQRNPEHKGVRHMIKLGKVSTETRDAKFINEPEGAGPLQLFF